MAQRSTKLSERKEEQGSQGAEEQRGKNSPLRPRSPAPRQSSSILSRDGLALIAFVVLTCVMTNPLVLHIANAVEDKQDALLNTWIIAWVGHALITDPLNLFNANIFYPYPNTLAFSETMLPQGLFALPFNLAFDNTVLGYNLVLLASFFLAAYAMYLFVFDLTRSRGAGIVAGAIFAFNPYNLGNLAQVQLLSFGWMPLVLLWLRRLLNESTVNSQQSTVWWRMASGEWRIVLLFALFFSLQALSSFYYAFLAGFAVALYVIWFVITHASRASRNPLPIPLFTRLAISAILIVIIVVPFFIPYLQVQREMGFERKVVESEPFSASLKLYTEVSPQNLLYGNLLAPRLPIMNGGYPLDNLFPGIIAFALAIIGFATTKNRDKWFYFLLLTFAFLLSLGPRLFLAPNNPTDLTLPYRWLYDAFPLMRALRAPVRFDALVMFALAVLAGWGVTRVASGEWRVMKKSFILHAKRSSFILLLIALEYLALPAAQITPVPVWDEIPQYVRWLAKQTPGVILELPMIASDPTKPLDLTTQYLSTYHWHSTPDGYSGFVPSRRGEVAYEMQTFPDLRPIRLIQALDVQYVVFHGPMKPGLPPEYFRDDLQLVWQHRIDDNCSARTELDRFLNCTDWIHRVLPNRYVTSNPSVFLYLPQPAAPNQIYLAYMIIDNSTSPVLAIKPTDILRIDARWHGITKVEQQTSTRMPLVTTEISVIPVQLTAPPDVGSWRLDLTISGQAIPTWNLSGNVSVEMGEPAHETVIPATITSDGLLSTYAPGDNIQVLVGWQPHNKIDSYYSVSVRVVDQVGNKIVAVDRQPATPTLLWRPDRWQSDLFKLTLPNDLSPGEYSVEMKMYQADQGTSVLIVDWGWSGPADTIPLGKFTVK
ncbi:hypothetical protein ANRL1_02791 [Anaerolineae bacterium]|nr:hypothetical protein ANRL1_02791 [Anaerolineae bacterium]